MKQIIIAAAWLAAVATTALAHGYDIVILNGRVMDPATGLDAIRNVGVDDGKIVAVTKDDLDGDRVIDATGLVVAPGFIDMHSHATDIPIMQKLMLRNGVTTPLELEVGAWPVGRYYETLKGKSQTNYGASVSLFGIREALANPDYKSVTGALLTDLTGAQEASFVNMSFQKSPTSPEQIEEILTLMQEGVDQGGVGLSVPVGYAVKGITSEEVIGIQKIGGENDLPTFVHARFSSQASPTSGILGFSEFIANTAIYGGGLLFHHIHQQALGQTPKSLELISAARAAGINVMAEVYPYNFGATIVGADYLVPDNYGPNMGRTFSDIIEQATGLRLDEARFNDLIKTNPGASVMFYGAKNPDMLYALKHPSSVVGSDAFPLLVAKTGKMAVDWDTPYESLTGHPRAAGSYALILRMVREDNLMPLMTAIGKMSYDVAKFLQDSGIAPMAFKGRIQVGTDADITIFDPETVTDNSTIEAPGLPSTGIPYVIVSGTVVVDDSKVLEGVFPGQPVRMPIKAQ